MKRLQRLGLAVVMLASVVFSMGAEPIRTYMVPDPSGGPDIMITVLGLRTIAEINENDANGRASLGEQFFQVTVRGVVQSATGDLDPEDVDDPSAWFYIADGTGSVAVTRATAAGTIPAVSAGDSVEVITSIFTQQGGSSNLIGTRTLDFANSFSSGDAINFLAPARPVNAPTPVTLGDLTPDGTAFEGVLVTADGVTVVDPGAWPLAGQSGFVQITDGVDTISLFVDDDTDLDETSAPGGSFSLTGFVSQNDPDGTPFFEGHFIYPRSTGDIVQGDGDGTAVVSPSLVTEGTSPVSLLFTLAGVQATLTAVELEVPASWTWTGSDTDVTLGGAGFAVASPPVVTPAGGSWQVRIDGTNLSSTASGTIQLANLTAPAVESSIFTVRTSAGGPAAPILVQPVVGVISAALAGEVVINELMPAAPTDFGDFDEGEFIELHNRTASDIVIDGWTLQDIGRTNECTLDARWAFPVGTVVPAMSYLVVCRDALIAPGTPRSKGFLVDFPDFPTGIRLLEMYDASSSADLTDEDDPGTDNMILLDGNDGADDQIVLLGGPSTNAGQCESSLVPFAVPQAELVVLRNAFGATIDAVYYEEPGPCDEPFCDTSAPAGAPYAFGAPKAGHSLGRDDSGTDSNVSSLDLKPATRATPGEVNEPGDTEAPGLVGGRVSSGTVFDLVFDEVVDETSAEDVANYSVSLDGERGSVAVLDVDVDRLAPFRHYVLVTEPISAGVSGTLTVDGVTDRAGNTLTESVSFTVPNNALTICEIQSFDERGFSPHDGEVVTVAGFVTILPTSSDRFGIWVQEPGVAGCGVNVFNFDYPVDAAVLGIQLNDMVQVQGRVTEFVSSSSGNGAVTEIAAVEDVEFFELIARGLEGPEPRLVSTHGANDETLEGTLVRTSGTVINANSLAAYIDDGSGSIQVFQNFSDIDLTRYTVGDALQVTGVLTQFDSTEPFFSGYELIPQNQDAIVELDGSFSRSGPVIQVGRGVLVPEMGEEIRITVTTPRRSDVIVEIYDVTGRKVTTLYDGIGLGLMTFDWDGVGQDGSTVDPGAYVCHVRAVALDGGSVLSRSAPIVVGMRLN